MPLPDDEIRRRLRYLLDRNAAFGVWEPPERGASWDPLRDARSAHEVLAFMRTSRGLDFSKSCDPTRGWTARFGYRWRGVVVSEATEERLERAICLAALAACGFARRGG